MLSPACSALDVISVSPPTRNDLTDLGQDRVQDRTGQARTVPGADLGRLFEQPV